MKIGEVSEVLGISISNIRFYEKKGLVGPARDKESKYRNYTAQDVDDMKSIIVLRKMGVPIEAIADIQSGKISLVEAISNQVESLKEEEERIASSKKLCAKALGEESLDINEIAKLFDYVEEEEKQGVRFGIVDEFIEGVSEVLDLDNMVTSMPFGFFIYTNHRINKFVTLMIAIWFIGLPLLLIPAALSGNNNNPKGLAIMAFFVIWELLVCYHIFTNLKRRKVKDAK